MEISKCENAFISQYKVKIPVPSLNKKKRKITELSSIGCWSVCSNIIRLHATDRNCMPPVMWDFTMVLCIMYAVFYSVSVSPFWYKF